MTSFLSFFLGGGATFEYTKLSLEKASAKFREETIYKMGHFEGAFFADAKAVATSSCHSS